MRVFYTLKKKKKFPGQLSSSMAFQSCSKKHSQKIIFGVLFSLNSDSFFFLKKIILRKSPFNLCSFPENHGLSVAQVTSVYVSSLGPTHLQNPINQFSFFQV